MDLKTITFIGLLFCASCSNPPYKGSDVCGADEFVMDSYRIREGKLAILEMEGRSFGALAPDAQAEYPDLIQEGDLLKVALYHPVRADLSASVAAIGSTIGYRVTDGQMILPDMPPVAVSGLSLPEAKEAMQCAYDKEISGIEVFLAYQDRAERKVELLGQVAEPSVPIDGRIRLFEVLAQAHVPGHANWFKSYVVREDQLLPVDLYKLVKQGDMSQNIVMRAGDKIYIADPADSRIMVLGEVGKERVIDLPNGFMSLRQAIAEAGGIPFTGDKRYIQVIRGSLLCPKIYTLNWKHVMHLPSDSLLLMPGDLVYVAATPIAEWNRFVTQVLPTLVGIDLLMRGAKNVGVTLP